MFFHDSNLSADSGIAKSNTDSSYPSTEYGNKMHNVNILLVICKNNFIPPPEFSITLTVFGEFPRLFHQKRERE